MVATARLAAGLSGLRNRNTRVTNKTQLRVVRGTIEADPIILDDEDDEKNRVLASQGVDEEDANEHHLQAALFASSQRTLSTTQYKPETTSTDPNAFIPTPDAAGLVTEYNDLYPDKRYRDPATHLRFSDSLDEACTGGLSGSFTYFLDERDAEWLAQHNGAAKGEGTSTGGNVTAVNGIANGQNSSLRGVSRLPHGRSGKAKGKEPEHSQPPTSLDSTLVIEEDQFELVMGLFEKYTDEVVSPYLHLASDPDHFPSFDNYYNFLATPLPPSTFASFEVPSNLPPPEQMVKLAKAIYPWWKDRRMERNGHRIVPQLHVLIIEAQEKEDKTGGSPYTCFRKRDVKPMRKTRTNNVMHTEKLTRLRTELQNSLELAQLVLQRERLKREAASIAVDIWHNRESLAEYMKQLSTAAPGSVPPTDESLLFDKERKPRKTKTEAAVSGRIILAAHRRPSNVRGAFPDSLDPHSALALSGDTSHAFEECQKWPGARTNGILREVDRELAKSRKDDTCWEDLVDMPYQPIPPSAAERFFKPFPTSDGVSFPPPIQDNDPGTSRLARSLRLRVGRGGRLHLDRRLHVPKPHRLLQREWAGYPPRAEDVTAAQLQAERWAKRSWRPRDSGVRLGRRERELGEEYWAHHSIYDDDITNHARTRDINGLGPDSDVQDPTFGFEQSISGWDARELWARAKATREEEGWKPTPHLAVDPESLGLEVATRNAEERERAVEAWRGMTAETSCNGGALALFTDGDAAVEHSDILDGRQQDEDPMAQEERVADITEHAWRVDERWRYDSENFNVDDRFLMDDYQSKFLRTTITLLDARDHETIKTDPQLLAPLPPKQNRYLDHQLRLQHSGLPQLSSSSTAMSTAPSHSIPPRHVPPTNGRSPSSLPPSNAAGSHPRAVLLDSAIGTNNSTASGYVPFSSSDGSMSRPVPSSPPKTSSIGLVDASMNTVRTKPASNGMSLPQAGLPTPIPNGTRNGQAEISLNGGFSSTLHKAYPSLRTTLDQVMAAQQDSQQRRQQQPGRPLQTPVAINAVNGCEPTTMSMSLGVGNLQLKIPTQRMMLGRANVGENQVDNVTLEDPSSKQSAILYTPTHAQRLALPHLPSASTRTA
ncbi:hypothetical protein K439DRAFT_810742 [Ramaria rubella]|nr:hypothetical protein K439DRAFT_810742 [Ramaria rubella]